MNLDNIAIFKSMLRDGMIERYLSLLDEYFLWVEIEISSFFRKVRPLCISDVSRNDNSCVFSDLKQNLVKCGVIFIDMVQLI